MNTPPISRRTLRFFTRYLRRYFARHFTGVRIALDGRPPEFGDKPFILYCNHPSWWDPILLMLVVSEYYPGRDGYGPIDSAVIDRYKFLGRLGLFGVDPDSRTGLSRFLRTADAILARPRTILGITPEGEFRDPRARPVRLQPGVAHLLRRHPEVPAVPVAIEYPFWDERAPEALVRFGNPIEADERRAEMPVEELNRYLEHRLEETLDRLAEGAMARDPAAFVSIVEGGTGVGGIYDAGKRLKAWLTGRSFDPSHAAASKRGEK